MAPRMESHGVEGCIQVTERTCRRLTDRYRFQRRGPIQVKGKGTPVTYLLLGGPSGGTAATRSIPFKTAAALPGLAEGEFR